MLFRFFSLYLFTLFRMDRMKWRNILIYSFIFICLGHVSWAQTIKRISVSGNEPYVDHVSLQDGSADMDLLVKFVFDEPGNCLTVSLISYRRLFVFQSDVRYSQVVRCFKLRPSKLPYVVDSDERARYKLTKSLRKSIRPRRKHVFKRWIEYEGLQPQPTDYKMVNEYIEQRFDVLYKDAPVTVTLRDLLLMDEQVTPTKKKYDLFFQTDLNRKYEIAILRDPCFGKEEAIQAAMTCVENIKNSYSAFDRSFGEASVPYSADSREVFTRMKALLVEQYPLWEETNPCPEIQANIDLYNSYVDSIRGVMPAFEERRVEVLQLDTDYILALAKRMDAHVSRWLLSSDPAERNDLVASCEEIIRQARSHIGQASASHERQRAAIRVFNAAEEYFHKTCTE